MATKTVVRTKLYVERSYRVMYRTNGIVSPCNLMNGIVLNRTADKNQQIKIQFNNLTRQSCEYRAKLYIQRRAIPIGRRCHGDEDSRHHKRAKLYVHSPMTTIRQSLP